MKSLIILFVVVATARVAIAGAPPAPFDEPLEIVSFAFDSAAVDQIGRAELREAARWIATHPDRQLVIEAHTDGIGGDGYNLGLAARRAHAVRDALVALGAPRDRVMLSIFGKANPRSRTPTAAANRVAIVYATPSVRDEITPNDTLASINELRQHHS
jgi:outer membrane protein OmpA-like peptidoglycan-associated protein